MFMKFYITLSLLLISFLGFSQDQSIGLRLGKPSSVTYKKFVSRSHAFEVSLGSVPSDWGNSYYINSFSDYGSYDTYRYQNHQVQSTLYIQGRYLVHYPLQVEDLTGKVVWYWGLGGLFKTAKVQYRYHDQDAPYAPGTDIMNDIDFGPEAVLGLEYTFQDAPLTVFVEGSFMLELLDRPLTPQTFGAMGVRYNLRKQ